MSAFKLLMVEDEEKEINICRDSIDTYRNRYNREIKPIYCKTLAEALEKLDNTFDGAIIDLKLEKSVDDGNMVINEITEACFRIPVVILTGTPDDVASNTLIVDIFTKGEVEYEEIFNKLWDIYDTGLTRIMGGRGKMEKTLDTVFRKNLLPHIEKWIHHAKTNPERTEHSLLRYTINHLLQLLDESDDKFFPEEVYIYPPAGKTLKTGSIIKKDDKYFVVLNPMCDLVIRKNNMPKATHILLVEIVPQCQLTTGCKENEMGNAFSNNKTPYYHWLPRIKSSKPTFDGGFLDFRILSTHPTKDFNKKFKPPEFQISPSFVKDIVARFSSFYARQGQPDIDYEEIIQELTN